MRRILLVFCCLVDLLSYGQTNDHIFPPAAGAKSFIDFDAKGFLVGGRRVFLVSAGMEYARVPHALWEDRLLRLKRAGFNCIEVYTFWNFHEPRDGMFDFSGDHDLGAFLGLCKKMGLYVIARVGPYYCAEWDNGGYPLWLRFKPGLRVREDNAEFEKYVDRFFDRLMPIVSRNQVHRGGAVILVQLENEHPKGWGTIIPDGYFRHLRDKAVSLGLEVPYFFSGLHHSNDPAGDLPRKTVGMGSAVVAGGGDSLSLDDPSRPNPWMSTEFWSVWYNGYGSTDKEARLYERRTWKIIAHGGNGYNYYMAHGGSNFGYTNNDEDAASYDYGAAVGQAGDLRPIYYSFKRMGWFARSFSAILENSVDATATWKNIITNVAGMGNVTSDSAVRISARHSPAGELIFLDNPSAVAKTVSLTMKSGAPSDVRGASGEVLPAGRKLPAGEMLSADRKLPAGGPLLLGPGEIMPVVHDFVMDSAVKLEWAPVRILGISDQGNTTTMVIYGEPGSPAELYFRVRGKAGVLKGVAGFSVTGERVVLQTKFSDGRIPVEYVFRAGGKKWRILVVNSQLADRTWFPEAGGKQLVVCGPAYVAELRVRSDDRQREGVKLVAEFPWQGNEYVRQANGGYPVQLYSERSEPFRLSLQGGGKDNHNDGGVRNGEAGGDAVERKDRLELAPWKCRTAAYPGLPGYYDNDWKYSKQPLQMGADGDGTAEAWYRTVIDIGEAGLYTLQVEGSDRAIAFVDGRPAGSGEIRNGEITFNFSRGRHTLAFFTTHDGRDKLAAYLGSMDSVDRKGIFGNAILRKGGPSIVTLGGWHFLRASDGSRGAGNDSLRGADNQGAGLQGAGGQATGSQGGGSQEAGGKTAEDSPELLQRDFPAAGTAGWKEYTTGQDAFSLKQGFGWFRTALPDPGAGVSQIILKFKSVDENATVFINGRKIGRHEGWNQPFEVTIGGLDSLQRPLELTVFMENYSNEGGIDQPVRANYAGPGEPVTGWVMHGGVEEPMSIMDWKVLLPTKDVRGMAGPCFYRSSFVIPAYSVSGPHPIWRVHTKGLGHGSVWVNGHNLGRYPEKTAAPGLYIPECWLHAGRNTLIILDDDGKRPDQVFVQAERGASRDVSVFSDF